MSWAAGARPDSGRNEISPLSVLSRSVLAIGPGCPLKQASLKFHFVSRGTPRSGEKKNDRPERQAGNVPLTHASRAARVLRRIAATLHEDTSVALHGRVTFASRDARDLVAMAAADRSARAIGGGGVGTRAVGGQLRAVRVRGKTNFDRWNKATRDYITEIFEKAADDY